MCLLTRVSLNVWAQANLMPQPPAQYEFLNAFTSIGIWVCDGIKGAQTTSLINAQALCLC